jgi:hypothetical protein
MKPTRWLVLILMSLSLFGVACNSAEPEGVEPEATEEEVDSTVDVEEMEEDAEETEGAE